MMTFHDQYVELVRRHVGRVPKRSDGETEAQVVRCERRLAVSLPGSVRAYYLVAGRLQRLNSAHNRLFTLDELRIEDRHLWFMEENQAVVHWGLPIKALAEADPMVHQRANVDGAKWYSERTRFAAFLARVVDWQAGLADAAE